MEEFKMVVLGDGGVGKSALTIRFAQGIFIDEYDPTFEDSYRRFDEFDDRKVLFDIFDTASSEEFGGIRDQYIRTGQSFLLVYSITSRSSFENINASRERIQRIKDQDHVPMVLVGNKCDLESERQVSIEEGQELARSFGCPFFETSAKITLNVTEAFREAARVYIKQDLMKGEAGRPTGLPKAKDCLIM